MRAQSPGGSPPFSVSIFIGSSGWSERLSNPYRCFRHRSARGGGGRGWLSATRHPLLWMRAFGTVLVRMLEPVFSLSEGILRVMGAKSEIGAYWGHHTSLVRQCSPLLDLTELARVCTP